MNLAAALLLGMLVLGGGVGTWLRVLTLRHVAARGYRAGTAWVNVPASFVTGLAATVAAVGVGPGPAVVQGEAVPTGDLVALATLSLVVGVCGGLSTYSSLALEASLAVLRRDRRLLGLQLAGVGIGVVAAVLGVAVATAGVLFARGF